MVSDYTTESTNYLTTKQIIQRMNMYNTCECDTHTTDGTGSAENTTQQ